MTTAPSMSHAGQQCGSWVKFGLKLFVEMTWIKGGYGHF